MAQRPGGLSESQALRFAALPLRNLGREYPNSLAHFAHSDADMRPPRELHPIFWGSYDWHSCVHGFWLLARCLRRHPGLAHAEVSRAIFTTRFTSAAGVGEAEYFSSPGRTTWQRPYGWGWLLGLSAELAQWDDPQAAGWREALKPLESVILQELPSYLAKLTYPIRVGTHFNTAFGLLLALHYARVIDRLPMVALIEQTARRYFGQDVDYPGHYEPNGDDFLSGGLVAALLMSRLMQPPEFAAWFGHYLPGYHNGGAGPFQPAIVADRNDAKGVHLDGLNLSRAWCLRGIAATLSAGHSSHGVLMSVADSHEAASLPFLESGEYGGEHWLATFAALAIEGLED